MTTGHQVLGEPRPITLLDGSTVGLLVTNRALFKIEDLFGSYNGFQEEMAKHTASSYWHTVLKGAWSCLQHDEEWRNDFSRLVDSTHPDYVIEVMPAVILDCMADTFPTRNPEIHETQNTIDELLSMTESPGPESMAEPDPGSESVTASSGT